MIDECRRRGGRRRRSARPRVAGGLHARHDRRRLGRLRRAAGDRRVVQSRPRTAAPVQPRRAATASTSHAARGVSGVFLTDSGARGAAGSLISGSSSSSSPGGMKSGSAALHSRFAYWGRSRRSGWRWVGLLVSSASSSQTRGGEAACQPGRIDDVRTSALTTASSTRSRIRSSCSDRPSRSPDSALRALHGRGPSLRLRCPGRGCEQRSLDVGTQPIGFRPHRVRGVDALRACAARRAGVRPSRASARGRARPRTTARPAAARAPCVPAPLQAMPPGR